MTTGLLNSSHKFMKEADDIKCQKNMHPLFNQSLLNLLTRLRDSIAPLLQHGQSDIISELLISGPYICIRKTASGFVAKTNAEKIKCCCLHSLLLLSSFV